MMKVPNGFEILAESTNYILGHLYEDGYIIDRGYLNKLIYIGSSYGNPEYGLIDASEQWALLLGRESYIWMPGKIVNLNAAEHQHQKAFQWPFDARQVADFGVEVLDDPWNEDSGIYYLDITTAAATRIRDFKTLTMPYKEDRSKIKW